MRRLKTEGIVLHRAEIWSNSDYHLIVNVDGSVIHNVPIDQKGEHAIVFNANSIGIAVVGDFAALEQAKLSSPTQAQLDTCVFLLRELNSMFGGKLWVAGHSQLGPKGTAVPEKLTYGHTCPGERFPLAGVIAKSGLMPWLPPPVKMA